MTSQRATSEQRRERAELDPRFGKIGLSAVAAALHFGGDTAKPVHTPAKPARLNETEQDEAAA